MEPRLYSSRVSSLACVEMRWLARLAQRSYVHAPAEQSRLQARGADTPWILGGQTIFSKFSGISPSEISLGLCVRVNTTLIVLKKPKQSHNKSSNVNYRWKNYSDVPKILGVKNPLKILGGPSTPLNRLCRRPCYSLEQVGWQVGRWCMNEEDSLSGSRLRSASLSGVWRSLDLMNCSLDGVALRSLRSSLPTRLLTYCYTIGVLFQTSHLSCAVLSHTAQTQPTASVIDSS